MSIDKIKTVADILDIVMKAAVTAALALGSYVFNSMTNSIEASTLKIEAVKIEAQETKGRVLVMEAWANNFEKRQDRMEDMLSEVLKIARDSK